MILDYELLKEFAKVAAPKDQAPEETVLNGTAIVTDSGVSVRLDGAGVASTIPVSTLVEVQNGERVKVSIRDHTATITANISSPAARNKDVERVEELVNEIGGNMDSLIEQVSLEFQELETYVYKDELGQVHVSGINGGLQVIISPEGIRFMEGDNAVAYISNNRLFINKAELVTELKLGNYYLTTEPTGEFAILKR